MHAGVYDRHASCGLSLHAAERFALLAWHVMGGGPAPAPSGYILPGSILFVLSSLMSISQIRE
jgi:hypothetical protein